MADRAPYILVVDDDPDICANLEDILTDFGYRVDTAPNAIRAIELVKRNPYDVALLDLKLPDLDGVELYCRLRAERAGTVALIVTAYAGSETAASAIEAGAWRVLSKPVDPAELLPLIEDATVRPLVILVDDDPELCDNLWELLRERKIRACIAHDIEQARRRLEEQPYGVALINMKLPGGDGTSVLQSLRQSNPQARALLIAGHHTELQQQIQRTLAEGADAVCYKPFDVGQMLDKLEQLTVHES